jgi:hypothetical protein
MDSQDVETYYDNGVWKNRRGDCDRPFSSGPRRRQIAIGAEVARWGQASHIIRNTDGTIEEINTYCPGPFPARSPTKTVRRPAEPPTTAPATAADPSVPRHNNGTNRLLW